MPEPELCGAPGDAGSCVLPAAHDETLHQGPDGKYWLPEIDTKPTPGPEPLRLPPAVVDLAQRLTAALDAAPHFTPREVVDTVLRVLAEPSGDLRDQVADALRTGLRQIPGVLALPRPSDRAEKLADAVMPTVEAALARLETEIDDHIIKPERIVHEQTIQRAEQAEAAVRRARQILAGMHDGVLVRRLLAALDADQPETPRRPTGQDGGTWTVAVQVPIGLPQHLLDALFRAVTDAVSGWEPASRDGWDAEVKGYPTVHDPTECPAWSWGACGCPRECEPEEPRS